MTTTPTQVAAAYDAIVRQEPPGGSTGAFATSVAAQINQGLLTLGNFESSLIDDAQTLSTTLPALVTIDAFFGATPSSATLTNVAVGTATSGFTSALELSNLGYSAANVWTILGAQWASNTTASGPNETSFFQLYNGLATGPTPNFVEFINDAFQRVFGTLPTQAQVTALTSATEIANLTALLQGSNGQPPTTLQIMGGMFGALLFEGQSENAGAFAASANAFLADAATDEATTPGSSSVLFGPELLSQHLVTSGTGTTSQFLTTGADNVTGTSIFGSLTPFTTDGTGPTLNATDIITGSPGSTNNTLTISDASSGLSAVDDTLPVGVTISNIQDIILDTQNNAGGGALFDTTPFAGVTNVTINSTGGSLDDVRVSSTTALTVDHQNVNGGGGVQTFGGSTVTVTNNGGIGSTTTIGSTSVANANPTGAVTVNAVSSTTTVFGGTTVNVNQTGITAPGSSGITIGTDGFSVSPAEPSGAVTVNAPATSTTQAGTAVTVFGGASANITSGGGAVTIGALVGQTVFTVSGNDTVVDNAAVVLASNYITGATTGFPATTPLFGAMTPVTETAVSILGGQAVNVTTNTGGVTIGVNAVTAFNGTVLTPGLEPTGNVTVTDTSDLSALRSTITTGPEFGDPGEPTEQVAALTPVAVFGGANVTVTDSGSAVTIGDATDGSNIIAPTGAVVVMDTAQVANDQIINLDNHLVTDVGGTTVTITTNAGGVMVGTAAGTAGTEPTGNVSVTDTATDPVSVFGGANVTVAATNGAVTIGNGTAASDASGNVSVTETGLFTGAASIVNSTVTVDGGVNVTVTTTGGSVVVGTPSTPVTGVVMITDTQVGVNTDSFNVVGGNAATGASVTIATTATSGSITVGVPGTAALNAAGTALANPTDFANGTVSIVDESLAGSNAAGSSNVFGSGVISVNTNGATAVSIAGGSSATVIDEETTAATGGAAAGKPIGTSTLTTVTLDGVGSGASTLTSGVLANLTVLDSAKGNATSVTVNSPAALNLTLGNDATGTTITDSSAPSVTVSTSGTASSTFALDAAKATALTFSNTESVTLAASAASNDAAVATITATGSGALTLADFTAGNTADGALTSINASTATGAITVLGLNPMVSSFTGGSGVDTVTITNNSNTQPNGTVDKIAGGSNAGNTLILNYAAAASDTPIHEINGISGFSVLGLGVQASSALGTYDAGGFSSLTVGQVAGPVTFSDIGSGTENLAITASQGPGNTAGGAITLLLNDPGKHADTLDLTVGSTTSTLTSPITTTIDLAPDTITDPAKPNTGTENSINIDSLAPSAVTGANHITINDSIVGFSGLPAAGATNITVSGDFAADVVYNVAGAPTASSITSITATDTANVNVTEVEVSASGVTVTGGAGQITAFGSSELGGSDNTKAVDTFISGSGGAVFTLGAGGGWNTALVTASAPDGSNDSGNETVNLSASTAVSSTLNVGPAVVSINNGAGVGGITGFQAVASSKAADVIALTGFNTAKPALTGYSVLANAAANNSSPAGLQNVSAFISQNAGLKSDLKALDPNALLADLTFSSSNGVITFGAVDGNNINQFNPTQLLTAAEGIVSEEAVITGQDQVAVFSAAFAGLAANTFIVASDMFNNAVSVGSALTANVGHIFGATEIELNGIPGGITGFGATAAADVVETTGVSQVLAGGSLTLANGGTGNLGSATGKVFNDSGFSEDTLGLGSASSTNTYNNLGSFAQIDVTAAGTQGNLVVGAQVGTQGSDSFTLNFAPSGGNVTLSGLTVTSDDLVTVVTTLGATDTIGSFTDTNSTVATLMVTGFGNLTITNAISDAALTTIDAHNDSGALNVTVTEMVSIIGATGGDTINASAAGDTITIGSATAAITGDVFITANAANDTITLTHEAPGGLNFIAAASGPDTITVDLGTNYLAGTFNTPPAVGAAFATALGAGDTVNLHSGASFGGGAATDFVWVGSGSTVNLGTSTTAFGSGGVSDTATVAVIGDATGATSGHSPAMTVVTGFATAGANANLYLQFDGNPGDNAHGVPLSGLVTAPPTFAFAGGTEAHAQVNEASATSLASALDIAASQTVNISAFVNPGMATTVTNGQVLLNAHTALADWFQFGGNTYIVEALNTTSAAAAHAALGTSDVVVELTGLVNVAHNAALHFV
jgi:hypothetical protein